MVKLKVAEIFYSLQGEGLWSGQPSIFLRTFGCNFQCRSFGLPPGERTKEPEQIAATYLKDHPDAEYDDLPLAEYGCDSYASWHPSFKHLSPMMDIDQIVDKIDETRWLNSTANDHVPEASTHLVITGGEPLLGWQRAYPELLAKTKERGYRRVTFETNGTQMITGDLKDYMIAESYKSDVQHRFTFSVSPKLPCSGESIEDALKPQVIVDYQRYGVTYLKFVVSEQADMVDVIRFVDAYRDAGWYGEVYLMPVGGTATSYNLAAPEVASLAMMYGYRYSPRLQVDLWKNAWGT